MSPTVVAHCECFELCYQLAAKFVYIFPQITVKMPIIVQNFLQSYGWQSFSIHASFSALAAFLLEM